MRAIETTEAVTEYPAIPLTDGIIQQSSVNDAELQNQLFSKLILTPLLRRLSFAP